MADAISDEPRRRDSDSGYLPRLTPTSQRSPVLTSRCAEWRRYTAGKALRHQPSPGILSRTAVRVMSLSSETGKREAYSTTPAGAPAVIVIELGERFIREWRRM